MHLVAQSELARLHAELRREIAALRHEIWMIEAKRKLEIQTAKTKAVWKRGLRVFSPQFF